MKARKITATAVLLLVAAALLLTARAQFNGGGGGGRGRGGRMQFGNQITGTEQLREMEEMDKALTPGFKEDVFTFARLKFEKDIGRGYRGYDDDAPQADLTLAYRLYQVTSLKLRPGFHLIDITTDELTKYPFVYAAAGGRMALNDDEASSLRRYLLNGGFMMVDDFWGDSQLQHLFDQMKRVFPDRQPVELTMDHRIFHTVYNFKQAPQIPSTGEFFRSGGSYDLGYDYNERSHAPHYFAICDSKDRIMVLICHNNHYGDGWEHESDDQSYFDRFSEPMGYPMFINILYYATTH